MLMPGIFYNDFNLFDDVFGNTWFDNRANVQKKLYGHNAKNLMSTDIKETDESFEMIVDLPGFKKEELTIELDRGYLTITAAKGLEEKEGNPEEKKETYIRRERYSGTVSRSFFVGEHLTQEEIKASFEHGILTLVIPKKDPKKEAAKKYIAIAG